MVRRVVVTVPSEHADEVLATLDRTRHCHSLTVVHGTSGNNVEYKPNRGSDGVDGGDGDADADGIDMSGLGSETPLRAGTAIITCSIVDKKLNYMMSELESIGVSRRYGSIDLIALEATMPYLNSRTDNRGRTVPNPISSITDRLTLAEIFTAVDFQCHMTFDYLAMCATAGMICCVGLLDDNVVLVVASMLVSPLMGPIMAFIYGTMMRDRHMVVKGVRTELSGVLVLFLVGVVGGLIILPFMDRETPGAWPQSSHEMNVRGSTSNLVTGVFVAIPSGIALALAITSDVVAPYVGVAIAAALLPPIVNAGLTAVLGIALRIIDGATDLTEQFLHTSYTSMLLLVINIAIIYLFGILTFTVKRVHPGTEYDKKMYMTRSMDLGRSGSGGGTLEPQHVSGNGSGARREGTDSDLLSKSPLEEGSSQLSIVSPPSPSNSPKQRALCVPQRFGRKKDNANDKTQPLRLNDAGPSPIIL